MLMNNLIVFQILLYLFTSEYSTCMQLLSTSGWLISIIDIAMCVTYVAILVAIYFVNRWPYSFTFTTKFHLKSSWKTQKTQ
jgi:hypothetical protein